MAVSGGVALTAALDLEGIERDLTASLQGLDRDLESALESVEVKASAPSSRRSSRRKHQQRERRGLAYSLPLDQLDAVGGDGSPPAYLDGSMGRGSGADRGHGGSHQPMRRMREDEERQRQLNSFKSLPDIAQLRVAAEANAQARTPLSRPGGLRVNGQTGYADIPVHVLADSNGKPSMATLSRRQRRSKAQARAPAPVVADNWRAQPAARAGARLDVSVQAEAEVAAAKREARARKRALAQAAGGDRGGRGARGQAQLSSEVLRQFQLAFVRRPTVWPVSPVPTVCPPSTGTRPHASSRSRVSSKTLAGTVRRQNDFDRNGDGTISAEELSQVLVQIGRPQTPQSLQRMLREVDSDSSGAIDFGEFLGLVRLRRRPALPCPALPPLNRHRSLAITLISLISSCSAVLIGAGPQLAPRSWRSGASWR